MKPFIAQDTPVTDEVLNCHRFIFQRKSLSTVVDDGFIKKLSDRDFMRIAFLLAWKGYEEGGSPIGERDHRQRDASDHASGKGHNYVGSEEPPPTIMARLPPPETTGRLDFSRTTMFTSLSPCDVCAALIYMRQFERLVVGDITNVSGNEDVLRKKRHPGTDILEDPEGVAFYAKYRKEARSGPGGLEGPRSCACDCGGQTVGRD